MSPRTTLLLVMIILAATAPVAAVEPPIADAGPDQVVVDSDNSGDEDVDLDGSASVDPDGTIVSYVWSEYGSQIATGETATVDLSLGAHLITLTCTDNDGYTGSDDLWVTVLAQGADPVYVYNLDISGGFNMDAWCGPREIQAIYHYQFAHDPDLDLAEAQGSLSGGVSWATLGQYDGDLMVGDSSVEPYSTYHNPWHPGYVENDEGSPESGYIVGANADYFIASVGGNPLLPGDWTEDIADPLTAIGPGGVASGNGMPLKLNALVVGSSQNTSDWQISESTAILPDPQQNNYSAINFVLCANRGAAHRARYMRIAAIYDDDSEEVLWAFDDTADDTPWPSEVNMSHPDFTLVCGMTQYYNNSLDSTGGVSYRDNALYEFALPLLLDGTKALKGIRVYDSNPSQNDQARGLTVFAAAAFAGCPRPPDVDVIFEDDLDWVYQNIQGSMANGGHKVALTVTVDNMMGNNYVTVTVQKKAGSGPGEITVQDGANDLEKLIYGSDRTLGASGDLILEVICQGDIVPLPITVEVPFNCRIIGDVDGNGGAEPTDVSLLINKLNGIATPTIPHDRSFDLGANGGAEPGDVSVLINVLNGVL